MLVVILVVAVLGIVGIVTVVHVAGGTTLERLGDEGWVLARYRRDVYGAEPVEALVDALGRAALVSDPEVGVAAMVVVGDGVVTRPIGPTARVLREADTLTVSPGELLLGSFVVQADPDVLAVWQDRIARAATHG